jgi:multimeric flavodoxin WrbA
MAMRNTYVIISDHPSSMLLEMINTLIEKKDAVFINSEKQLYYLKNSYIIFACELNLAGICDTSMRIMSTLRQGNNNSLENSRGAVLVHSQEELYTKAFAQWIILNANMEGCCFPGHPVVEATGSLKNYLTWQKAMCMPLKNICLSMCTKLRNILYSDETVSIKLSPKVLALHASERKTSNTLLLWNLVKRNLLSCSVQELHVENGSIRDCNGCSFTTCIHYSRQGSCFYGGAMVDSIYPAIESADAIVWICPNYNDAISANLTAVINRLTALYRKISFHNKAIFAVVVSGNSGGDSVARQLLGSLVINKGFCLPPNFALYATANDPFSILKIPDIETQAADFAASIEAFLLK